MNNQKKYVDKIITPGYIVPSNLCNTFAEDWFKLALSYYVHKKVDFRFSL